MARGKKSSKKRRGGGKKSSSSTPSVAEEEPDTPDEPGGKDGAEAGAEAAAAEEEEEDSEEEDSEEEDSEEDSEEELTTEERLRNEARARARAEKEAKRRARAEKARRKKELAALGGPAKVRLRHVLVKHTGSRNAFSKRTMHEVTTSPAAARAELEAVLATLRAIESADAMREAFVEFATLRSDCDTHKAGGDMGLFPRGNMHPLFDDVAFGLDVGQLADQIVETDSGLHLLLRIG
jgi:parvulin-like peptidyl-prolyl isomerase